MMKRMVMMKMMRIMKMILKIMAIIEMIPTGIPIRLIFPISINLMKSKNNLDKRSHQGVRGFLRGKKTRRSRTPSINKKISITIFKDNKLGNPSY